MKLVALMFGLGIPELIVILFTLAMPLLTLLLAVFIVYRFWQHLKRRDEEKRAAAHVPFPIDAEEDLQSQTLWETGERGEAAPADAPSSCEQGTTPMGQREAPHEEEPDGEAPATPCPVVSPESSEPFALLNRIAAQALLDGLAARGLSERERVVVQGVCAGKTLAVLADELGVSRSTVGTYCSRAYEKLGVSSKEGAQAELSRLRLERLLGLAGLSEREAEVVALAAEGLSVTGIASKLVLSEATVSSHIQQAYIKLGIHSRAELAAALRGIDR